MTTLYVGTCNHLGDTLCLSAALHNAVEVMPNHKFVYCGNYGGVFENTPVEHTVIMKPGWIRAQYRDFGVDSEYTAVHGTLLEGINESLSKRLGIDIPCVHKTPVLNLTEQEIEEGLKLRDKDSRPVIVANTNCQTVCDVKGYPWYAEVFRQMPDVKFILMGGTDSRDIRYHETFPNNVVDLRGQTSFRQLFSMVYSCDAVLSPPSAVVHISAAFGTPAVCITGAREPIKFTQYPNVTHVFSTCVGKHLYNQYRGCMHFTVRDARSCEHVVVVNGRRYPSCMACIPAEFIVEKLRGVMK